MPAPSPHDDKDSPSQISFMLGQLTAKVDTLLTNQTIHNERHNQLETRVTDLEKDKAKMLGAAVVVSSLAGAGLNYFF